MMTDTEIRIAGMRILARELGDVEAERFVALIQRERFDYTKWRATLHDDRPVEAISAEAMALRAGTKESGR